jgi:exopolysaccharide biosynthesis polyprenyl glycosylphosphotransferase
VTGDKPLERAVLLQDVSVLVLSLLLAHLVREPLAGVAPVLKPAVPPSQYVHLLLVFLPTWALVAERLDLHRVRTLTGPLVELLRALLWTQSWGTLVLTLILVAAQVNLNRSLIALFLTVSTLLLTATKLLQRAWAFRTEGEALALALGASAAEAEAIGRWRGRRVERLDSLEPEALRRRLQAGGVDEVLLPPRDRGTQRGLVEACAEVGATALVAVERLDVELPPPRAEAVGPTLYLTYRTHEPELPSRFVKALIDRAVGLVMLLMTLPLMLAIAVAVKLTSRGPILFVQERGGLHGRPFRMLKFRTMREGAEAERAELLAANEMDGPVFKIAEDPRVTRLGRFLRRTSMDELPQLVNVVRGDMSLVGPRPLPVVETRELTGIHRRRLSMRPGITCLWQISGRSELGFGEWMALDLQYVDHWSLGLDFAILLRTLPALVSGRGAR